KLSRELKIRVVAHGVDHGLRSAAASELAEALRLAGDLGVPFGSTRVDVAQGSNLMARAREARFEALRAALGAARRKGDWGGVIATGHHADDRAETMLQRLLRGTGPAGLVVLPARDGDLVRPLIRARRSDILSHVDRHEIPFAKDPTNLDARFLRS